MSDDVIPLSYKQWRNCIEVRCKIRLTPAFIRERLAELSASRPRAFPSSGCRSKSQGGHEDAMLSFRDITAHTIYRLAETLRGLHRAGVAETGGGVG